MIMRIVLAPFRATNTSRCSAICHVSTRASSCRLALLLGLLIGPAAATGQAAPLVPITEDYRLTSNNRQTQDKFGWSVAISGTSVLIGEHTSFRPGAAYLYGSPPASSLALTASNAQADDEFGHAVALTDDIIVVGAPGQNSSAGAAYIFGSAVYSPIWGEFRKLSQPNAQPKDNFGTSVAASGNTIVVGANLRNSAKGSAYVFERNQGGIDNWGLVKELTASDGVSNDLFGSSVSISGDKIAIGAMGKDFGTGAVYLFDRNLGGSNNWGQTKELVASDAETDDTFGSSIAISGNTLIVGAPAKNGAAGEAYLFDRDAGGANNWGEVKALSPGDGALSGNFGANVSIAEDRAVVGAPGADSGAGRAYVFERNFGAPNGWGLRLPLKASDSEPDDGFGYAVSISPNAARVAIGSPFKLRAAGQAYQHDLIQAGKLRIEDRDTNLVISWTGKTMNGVLETSSDLKSWTNSGYSTSPVTLIPDNTARFYRLRDGSVTWNAAGYLRKTVPPGKFVLLGDPFPNSNYLLKPLDNLLPFVPSNTTTAYLWNDFGFDVIKKRPWGWTGSGSKSIGFGAGFFLKNDGTAPFTITMAGEVFEGNGFIHLSAGFNLVSSFIPHAGKLEDDLMLNAYNNDTVYRFDPSTGYSVSIRRAVGWNPEQPLIEFGEGFWIQTPTAKNWEQSFSVAP